MKTLRFLSFPAIILIMLASCRKEFVKSPSYHFEDPGESDGDRNCLRWNAAGN